MGDELEEVAEGFGYTEVSHVMEVFGLCPVAPEVSWLIPFLEMRLFAK